MRCELEEDYDETELLQLGSISSSEYAMKMDVIITRSEKTKMIAVTDICAICNCKWADIMMRYSVFRIKSSQVGNTTIARVTMLFDKKK